MNRIDSFDPPEANPAVRRGRRRPSGPLGFVAQSLRMGWRWLARMRTALYLLGVLALETLIATIVPQAPNVPFTVERWREGTEGPGTLVSGLIDAIGGYDVYGSPIFLATLLLLFTSLTACMVPRVRSYVRIVRRSQPPRTRHLGDQEQVAVLTTTTPAAEVHATARDVLGDRRWRLRTTEGEPDDQVAAEKGIVTREGGSLMFHLSFYVLLVGVVLGQLLGFVGQVGVVEGQSWTETAVGYWSYQPGRWFDEGDHRGFTMTLDEFEVDWYRDPQFGGQPRLFRSNITFTRPDGTTFERPVGGNDPAVVDGMKIHQLDWGYAPRVVITDATGEVVHDAFLTLNVDAEGYFGGAAKAPAAEPDVGLDLFLFPFAPEGDDGRPQLTGAPWADAPLLLFQQWTGDLQLSASQNVNELDTTGLERAQASGVRLGETVVLEDGTVVSFPELRRWVGFQVSDRPTVPLLLLGSLLTLVGLVPALYAYRRRLWVAAVTDPDTGRTTVTVAGRAFQRTQAFEDEFAGLVRTLRERLGAPDEPVDTAAGGRSGDAPERVAAGADDPTSRT
ncbi:MAG: cytochrome c biogenesis protein ResB [Actinomycetes bacterium]